MQIPHFRRSLLTILALLLLCSLVGGLYGSRVKAASDTSDSDLQQNVRRLALVYDAIERYYADPVDPEKVIYNGAIQGMIRTLDPHSNFVDPKTFKALREERQGHYYGVGMTVQLVSNQVTVRVPFEGSPALRAGLRPGDIILSVDGHSCAGLGTQEVADMLRGPRGTQVHVVVEREGLEKPLEFDLIRDEIPRPSVDLAYEVRPRVGYIHINTFSETTGREAAAALRQLNAKTLQGLILDLRDNRGGLVSEAVAVADMLLAKGLVIVSHRGRASKEKTFVAENGNGGIEYSLVVLINENTASASEIVAGAIQDHDRGLVVGETSFGKGLVQNEYPLSFDTGLLLTIARYYTPSGRMIQRQFNGISLYDYYFARDDNRKVDLQQARQVKLTDSGRPMFGGGGIAPDEKVSWPTPSRLMRRLDGLGNPIFFKFSRHYLAVHKTISHDFEVNDAVMAEFRQFLDSQKIAYTENELQQDLDTIKRLIKAELFVSVFGKPEGDRIVLEGDPQLLRAIELLPKAKQLADTAHHIVAQHLGKQ
jgi:carboxyl-terminal processing protease